MTPPELIKRGRAGDREAQRTLYETLSPEVQRFLLGLRLGLRANDLDDALQETFLRMLQGLADWSGRSLKAWTLGIARNVALDLRWRGPKGEPATLDALPGDDTVERQVLANEQRAGVSAAMACLTPQSRALLVLRHLNGLSMQELADSLGCSLPTARQRLREAGAQLKIELRRGGGSRA